MLEGRMKDGAGETWRERERVNGKRGVGYRYSR